MPAPSWFIRSLGVLGLAAGCLLLGACRGGTFSIDPTTMADLNGISNVPPELAKMEFMSGSWRTLDEDGLSEEIWSFPHGKSMSGVFRLAGPDGLVQMQEILCITAEPKGVFLRLRHFDAKLIGREEKDAPIVLKLESVEDDRAVFKTISGSATLRTITYQRVGQALRGEVAFTPESKRETITSEMRRLTVLPY